MSTTTNAALLTSAAQLQLVTFHVGNLLLGLEIDHIREINRQLETTPAPHAPPFVRGVINLRGEVVTVVDVRTLLDLPSVALSPQSRNVVIYSAGEPIGLVVDRIGDVLTIDTAQLEPPPANLLGVESQCCRGVHVRDDGLVALLDLEPLLAMSPTH